MGQKYMISAFDYPHKGYCDYNKQTKWLIVAVFWFVYYSIKHFGVDIQKRGVTHERIYN